MSDYFQVQVEMIVSMSLAMASGSASVLCEIVTTNDTPSLMALYCSIRYSFSPADMTAES